MRYMAGFAPNEARELWRRYVDNFEVTALAITGLREWPRDFNGRSDIDSGPIIMGVGAAATGFGIGAARAVGDHERHRRLLRTMNLVYTLAPQSLRDVGSSILARSIALQGTYLERWYERAAVQ